MKGMLNHKELAVTGKISGQGANSNIREHFAKGGMVGAAKMPKQQKLVVAPKGAPANPLTTIKRNNGVPGFKKGGKAC